MQQYASWPDEALEDPHVREAAEAMFHTADIDGDGRLSARELQYGMLLIAQYAARELTFDIIGLVDKDGDGLLGREEVRRAMERASRRRREDQASITHILFEAFPVADINKDGNLNFTEVSYVAGFLLPPHVEIA